MASRPCIAKLSSQTASTAASTTGSSGPAQPAITALTATFSTVACRRRAGRPDEVLRVARGVLEHRHDALGRGRHHRQAVGQPALVQRLERILELAHAQLARADAALGARAARRQPCRDLGVARE